MFCQLPVEDLFNEAHVKEDSFQIITATEN